MADPENPLAAPPASTWRFAPVLLLLAGLAAAWVLGLPDFLSCTSLRDNRAWLMTAVRDHAVLAVLLFFLVYTVTVALSLPGGAVLTIAGGFLFGTLQATLVAVCAATLGAAILFAAARTAFADLLRARVGPWLDKIRNEFAAEGFSYLLFMRLVPVFPFFVVNLVPAFLGVSLRHYVLATLIGIIPGTFVFASVGAGLSSVFNGGGTCSLENILTTQVLIALIGLALLALLPVAHRKWRQRRGRLRK